MAEQRADALPQPPVGYVAIRTTRPTVQVHYRAVGGDPSVTACGQPLWGGLIGVEQVVCSRCEALSRAGTCRRASLHESEAMAVVDDARDRGVDLSAHRCPRCLLMHLSHRYPAGEAR